MRSLKDGFRRFMVGRYGTDELNRFLSVLILAFVVLHMLVRSKVFFWLEVICLVLVYVRMFSRDTGKRFRENQAYLRWRFNGSEWGQKFLLRLRERQKYKIFKCPQCSQKLRIPRGHGKVQIHCRSCGHDFMGRS